ncbi:MAG: YggS family pyridoxal phosphate-dependent enzyme [Nitrospirae bacterium]|nr:YggS family pyridoxal phosphate-dependent enzyme [Nitrospirota bacterium]MDA1303702.1 YggS family pyridoxal phosphate-dependent enzyme [Nitrospirota bacterium]
MTDIAANVQFVLQTIRDAALQAGRDPQSVKLVGVTKYVEAERVREAILAGIHICGENRLQEAQTKMETIGKCPGVAWHFIGRLQRRKLKSIVGQFAVIHSVDSLEQAKEIHRRAEELQQPQSILLQVNVGNEATKGGFSPSQLLEVLPVMGKFSHANVCGLMAIPPRREEPEAMRPYFRRLKTLADDAQALNISGIELRELSMGMSNDYAVAIQEGATMVRIGSALFGDRPL